MKNVNESGRSMVEMLGVLAIIGVLSIGGIMGYTRAMANWKANEIIDAMNRVAVAAETDMSTGTQLTYSDLGGTPANIAGGLVDQITATKSTTGGTPTVEVSWKSGATTTDVVAAIKQKLRCDGTGENCFLRKGATDATSEYAVTLE